MLDWDVFGVLWKGTQLTICQLYKSVVKTCYFALLSPLLMIHFGEKTKLLCFLDSCRHFVPPAIFKSAKWVCLVLVFISVWIVDLHSSQIPQSATRKITVALPFAAICTLCSFLLTSVNFMLELFKFLLGNLGGTFYSLFYVPRSTDSYL